MLSPVLAYGADTIRHQWDGRLPVRLMLPTLIASTAVTAATSAALGVAAFSDTEGVAIESGYGALAQVTNRAPPPFLLRDLAPTDALSINSHIPLSTDPNPPAQPFRFTGDSVAYSRALECLAAAVYYEAGNESAAGKYSVAQVVLNRVRHPAFAKSVCGVVYEGSTRSTGCQFTFTCDGSLRRRPNLASWRQSLAVARATLDGAVYPAVGYATHYHANYVVPYWATSLIKNAVIGTHIFYRWPASWGRPGAFNRRYDGSEIDPRLLRHAALQAHAPGTLGVENVRLESDPRVELVSIVAFLALNPAQPAQESLYRHQVRSYFWSHSNHLAIQLYRQLTAGETRLTPPQLAQIIMHYSAPPLLERRSPLPPELVRAAGGKESLAGLVAALRDFAAHTDFARFYREQQPVYAQLAAQAQAAPPALDAAGGEMGALSIETPTVILAPLLQDAMVAGCEQPADGPPNAWLVVSSGQPSGPRSEASGSGVSCETVQSAVQPQPQPQPQPRQKPELAAAKPPLPAAIVAGERPESQRLCSESGCERARVGDGQRPWGAPE